MTDKEEIQSASDTESALQMESPLETQIALEMPNPKYEYVFTSDIEGREIFSMFNISKSESKYDSNSSNTYGPFDTYTIINSIMVGDLIDSTGMAPRGQPIFSNETDADIIASLIQSGKDVNSSNKKQYLLDKRLESFEKTLFETFIEERSYNLRNIYKIAYNPHIEVIFGNRDGNKLKCHFLCTLTPVDDNDAIRKFNDGIGGLDYATYMQVKDGLNVRPWVHDMQNWFPFWNQDIQKYERIWKDKKNTKFVDSSGAPSQTIFLDRFNDIFGIDGSVGTMSAHHLLHSIPYELGVITDPTNSNFDDYKAFIVIAIFKSLLTENLDNEYYPGLFNECEIKGYDCIFNILHIKGLLRKMFLDEKNKFCNSMITTPKSATDSRNIYIYSHGLLINSLVSNPGIIVEFYNKLNQSELQENMSDIGAFLKQNGGARVISELIPEEYLTIEQIHENIIEINRILKEILARCLNLDPFSGCYTTGKTVRQQLDIDVLFMLLVHSGLRISDYNSKYNTSEIEHFRKFAQTAGIFPVTGEMEDLLGNDKAVFAKNGIVVFIKGHKPFGLTTSLYGHYVGSKENLKKNIIVNLDTSNSFISSQLNGGGSFNTLWVNLQDSKFRSYDRICLNPGIVITHYDSAKISEYIVPTSTIAYISDTTRTEFNFVGDQHIDYLFTQNMQKVDELLQSRSSRLIYHNMQEYNGQMYVLFIVMGQGFNKTIYYLPLVEYKKINDALIVQKQHAAEKLAAEQLAAEQLATEKLAADKLAADKLAADKLAADKLAAEQLAADKYANKYANKYLKYKSKYLNYKQSLK